jgi:hypothetical protein
LNSLFFFSNFVANKVYEVAFLQRAELSGKFKVRAARVECMCDSDLGNWSKSSVLKVKD